MQEYGTLVQDLEKSGHYVGGAKLRPTATAVTVRQKSGDTVLMDGPFAETKEQLGGFHLLECRDLEEALSIAKRIPTLAAGGVVEVRAVEK